MQELQQKERLKDILISKGWTDQSEIERTIESVLNTPADMAHVLTPENRVKLNFIRKPPKA